MKKKTILAAGVMALAILAAIPLGANRSFARLYAEASGSYYYDSTGYAIYQGLEARQATAQNLITVARRYTDQDEALPAAIEALEYQVKLAESASYCPEDLAKAVEADRAMGDAAAQLAERLETLTLAERDQKYPRQLLADLDAEADKLARSSYNDDARAYNARLEKFPIRFLRGIAGIQTMAVYEKG